MYTPHKFAIATTAAFFVFCISILLLIMHMRSTNTMLLARINMLHYENQQLSLKFDNSLRESCVDPLFLNDKETFKNYKLFMLCGFVSGEYGDTDKKNVFGIQNITTGKKYIIGATQGIFGQNQILEVLDDRYVFLANMYEGGSSYIMVDTDISWPTQDAQVFTVFPRTVDQYLGDEKTYEEIVQIFNTAKEVKDGYLGDEELPTDF